MVASLSPSELPNPRNRDAVDEWLIAQENALADLIADRLTRIVRETYQEFIDTLLPDDTLTAASGDTFVFENVVPRWNIVINTELVPELERLYMSGAIGAYTYAPTTDQIPVDEVQSWARVVNTRAVEYAASSVNRLVGVGETVYSMMRQKTQAAIKSGATVEELKSGIQDVGQFSEFRADVVARTEVGMAYSQGDYDGMSALGEHGPVEKEWLATGGPRTRATHREADGQVRPFNEPFDVGSAQMMFARQPGAPAKEVIQCRCTTLYHFEGDTRRDGSIVRGSRMNEPPPVQIGESTLIAASDKLRAGTQIAESQNSKVDYLTRDSDRDEIKARHKRTVEKMARQVKGYRSDDGVNFARTAMQADEVFVASVDDDIAGAIGINKFSASKLGTPEDAYFIEHLGSMRIVDGVGSQLFTQVVKHSSNQGLGIVLSPSDDLAFAWWESVGARVDPYGIGSPDLGLTSKQVKDLASKL